jgi:hypothetical protein
MFAFPMLHHCWLGLLAFHRCRSQLNGTLSLFYCLTAKRYINDTLPKPTHPFSPHPDSHPLELLFRQVHHESLVIGVLFFEPIVVVEFTGKIGDMATIAGRIAIVTYSWPRF